MSRKKRISVALLIICVLLTGMSKGLLVHAEENVASATDMNSLKTAIKEADEGDTILIFGEIIISNALPDPKGKIIIKRVGESSCLKTYKGVQTDFHNMIFDGSGVKSDDSFITVQGDFNFNDCIFKNCGDLNNFSGSGCVGAAVKVEQGGGTFDNCIFQDNSAIVGGHVAVVGNGTVVFSQCNMTKGKAVSSGGAIAVIGTGNCEIESCIITDNSAGDFGGGISNRGTLTVSESKIFGNTATNGGADIGNEIGSVFTFQDSVEQLQELFVEDNIIIHGWVCDYDFEEGIYIPNVEPTAENALLKLDYEYKQPEPEIPEETEPAEPDPTEPEEQEPTEPVESEEQPTETEEPDESQPEQPPEEEPDPEPGTPDEDDEEPTTPSTSSEPSVNNNSATTTTTTNSNSSTDNSDRSIHSTTTDNSRREEINDSNNTSTINNYYAQDQQSSKGGESVQTIVVPAGSTGSGEPIEQTIRVEAPDSSTGTDGMTLNVNVNVGEGGKPNQEVAASPKKPDGVSWYQVTVLCLLSAILVCMIKKH